NDRPRSNYLSRQSFLPTGIVPIGMSKLRSRQRVVGAGLGLKGQRSVPRTLELGSYRMTHWHHLWLPSALFDVLPLLCQVL
ncbi:MAG: hypothetical protein K2X93_08980, partial [Candidatus Obscuribacterales bacterium]|nr:hypothetical protein [Candidatus Obscuribacterales bacterium]